MKLKNIAIIGSVILYANINAQNVAINTTGAIANPSAMLDVDATDRGLLIPRVALVATNNNAPVGAGVATSLMVYNTATAGAGNTAVTPGYYYWNGTQWMRFITGALPGPAWMVTGNAGTVAATNFIGTTDAIDFVIRTNNTERMRITSGGYAGIGTNAPAARLTVTGDGTGTVNIGNGFCGGNYSGISLNGLTGSCGVYNILSSPTDQTLYINRPGGNSMHFRENNGTQMIITSGGNVGINAGGPAVRLAVNGNGVNVYATDAWIENNLHVQGNENLNAGGRGRLRVGTAWNYIGLYAEGSSSGANNDLVLGASSGIVRVGPGIASGQHLRWSGSTLRDDQGGSIELGGTDFAGLGGSGTPYIDWHINDGYTRDYDFRMIGSTDAGGDIMTFWTYAGNTLYRYIDFDWIGAYDCWADISAWRYWANATDWIYDDVVNDLDLIDNMKPKAIINPKTQKYSVINDPATAPEFLVTKTKDDKGYAYDIGATASFGLGAIRMLRKETKTSDEALDARVDRLEALIVQLTGKPLGTIDYSVKSTAYAGIETFVVIDARITKETSIQIEGLSNYTIINQEEGSFTVKFTIPPGSDTPFTYSGKF